jgi:hypothetical protein
MNRLNATPLSSDGAGTDATVSEETAARTATIISEETTMKRPEGKNRGCLFSALAVVIFIIFIVIAAIGNSDGGSSRDSESGIIIAAQNAVKQKLRSPTSSSFLRDAYVVEANDRYNVKGTVRAKNAFGVEIEHTYKVQISKDGKNTILFVSVD